VPIYVTHLPQLLPGLILFLVFLKIEALEISEKINNYNLMIYIAFIYMIIIPELLFMRNVLTTN